MRGAKKPGLPNTATVPALSLLNAGRIASSQGGKGYGAYEDTRSQKARSRSTRFSGGLPAISAVVMAPMETPTTQVGTWPASARASYTPL